MSCCFNKLLKCFKFCKCYVDSQSEPDTDVVRDLGFIMIEDNDRLSGNFNKPDTTKYEPSNKGYSFENPLYGEGELKWDDYDFVVDKVPK